MTPLPLLDPTRRLGAPPDWDHARDGPCHTLEICDRDGFMLSVWQPSEEERRLLAAGANVLLHVQGTSHPVVALGVAGGPT